MPGPSGRASRCNRASDDPAAACRLPESPGTLWLVRVIWVVTLAALLAVGTVKAAEQREGHRVGAAGVSLVVPTTWSRISFSATANTDPATRAVLSSGPIRFGRGCNDIDYVIGPRSVAIVLVEWRMPTPGARWMPRPARFTATNLLVRPGQLECFRGPGGGVQFAQHGRRFAAFLLAGKSATRAQVGGARAVLDTLRVKPRR